MKRLNFMLALGAICIGGFLASCERSTTCTPKDPAKKGGSAIITIEEVDAETGVVTRSYARNVTWDREGGDVEISGPKKKPFDGKNSVYFELNLAGRENVVYKGWTVSYPEDDAPYEREENPMVQDAPGLHLLTSASFDVENKHPGEDTHVNFRVEYVRSQEKVWTLPHIAYPTGIFDTNSFSRINYEFRDPFIFRGDNSTDILRQQSIAASITTAMVRYDRIASGDYSAPYVSFDPGSVEGLSEIIPRLPNASEKFRQIQYEYLLQYNGNNRTSFKSAFDKLDNLVRENLATGGHIDTSALGEMASYLERVDGNNHPDAGPLARYFRQMASDIDSYQSSADRIRNRLREWPKH